MQVPASLQRSAPPHVPPVAPHRHDPLRHWLLLSALQAKQSTPLAPHWEKLLALQVSPSQHPGQLDSESHRQLPPPTLVQRWPGWHTGLFLQRQTPFSHRSPTVVQSRHATPPVPQLSVSDAWQTPLLQHPLGQVLALQVDAHEPPSQRQLPPTQVAGATHAAPVPQVHWPEAEQLSARAAVHAVQVPPSVPQVVAEGVRQAPAWQQPRGHETLSHWQAPLTQRWPEAQGAEVPQRQLPLLQLLARVVLQLVHAAPPEPQAITVGVRQVLPLQHPPSQLAAQSGHTPPSQLPVAQAEQLDPALPHCAVVLPGRQLFPSQQPLGHVVESQVHAPFKQVWPGPHSAPAPHLHAPPTQRSAATGSHAAHTPPPLPQRLRLSSTHSPFSQQPLGQLVASQICWAPTFTTTVVSAPARARPSACPLPTSAPEPKATTFTVTVPA